MIKQFKPLLALLLIGTLNNCKQKEPTDAFTFIDRNDYVIDSYNGLFVYKLSKSKQLMDGYYVVGNKVQKWEEFNVKEGLLNGDYLIFHNNGEIFSHSKYSNGKKHGIEKTYYPSGALKKETPYSNDLQYGTIKTYYESGQLETEATKEKGEIIESVTYDIIGNITRQLFIRDGRTITQDIRNGKVFFESISSNYDNFEAVKLYNDDGSLKVFLRMLDEGDEHYLIELDEKGNEVKRIDLKENPQEILKYQEYFVNG
ncbi:toxin-antitoxin system YwqK family antitoxin [Mangrovimonas sp. TPBH4]|uniref:toxin-antitoxin system YwqK family antitoxin n=1 Tax=Mangrovimonas sp. TPBH4 TaxID=1645914 RepID=UPI0006B40A8D|nr:hypothetical protein [Mangrovimonas sp. TPBH4]